MILRFLLLLLGLLPVAAQAQLSINAGVDTADAEIREVVHYFRTYLNSKPAVGNPGTADFWAAAEQAKYRQPDLLLYSVSSDVPLYQLGTATILSVKPVEHQWQIRTAFGWAEKDQFQLVAITRHYVARENGKLKLVNALTVQQQAWQQQKEGYITFHYPAGHNFNPERAKEVSRFTAKLAKDYQLPEIEADYYFAADYEEVQRLRGLEFGLGMGNRPTPRGMADTDNRIIYCGGLGEGYTHEFVHLYLNPLYPKSPLLEGVATFYGGSIGNPLEWHLARVHSYLQAHKEVQAGNFDQFYYLDQQTNPVSALQGLLCKETYEKKGLRGLKKLLQYERLEQIYEKEFRLKNTADTNAFYRQLLQKHSQLPGLKP